MSLTAGMIVNLVLLLILVSLGTVVLNSIVPLKGGFYFYSLPLAAITLAVFGFGGKRSVKPFHEGVLHILGTPSPRFVLINGIHWLFPGIFSIGEVDMRTVAKSIVKVKTFTKTPDPVRIEFQVTIPWRVSDSYKFLTVSTGQTDVLLGGLAEQVMLLVSQTKGLEETLGMQNEYNKVFGQVSAPEPTPDDEKKKYGISIELDESTADWGIKTGSVLLSDPEFDSEVVKDLERGRREKLQRRFQRTEAAHNIEVINAYAGDPLPFEAEEVDPLTNKVVTSTKSAQLKTPLSPEAAVLLHQTETGKVVKAVDEKRIVIPEESRGVIEAILSALLGRKDG